MLNFKKSSALFELIQNLENPTGWWQSDGHFRRDGVKWWHKWFFIFGDKWTSRAWTLEEIQQAENNVIGQKILRPRNWVKTGQTVNIAEEPIKKI